MKGGEFMKTSYIVIGVVALIAVVGGILMLNNSNSSSTENQTATQSDIVQDDSNINDSSNDVKDSVVSQKYVAYSEANLATATENNGRAVVFFHAEWCPNCKAAEADFQANLNALPEDITILKADYDTASDLKKKYSVVMQDTFVQVDSNGKEIAKWNGGGEGVSPLLANIK